MGRQRGFRWRASHATALAAGEAPHGLLQVEAVEETAQDVPDLGV